MPKPVGDSRHVTLTAATVATITLDGDYDNVEIINVDGAAAAYFTADGSTPAVGATGSIVLPAAINGLSLQPYGSGPTTIKVISAGTPRISVRGW
jgi:hypothetical protein